MPDVKIAGKVIKRDDNLRYLGEDFQNRPVKAMKKLNNFEKGKKN